MVNSYDPFWIMHHLCALHVHIKHALYCETYQSLVLFRVIVEVPFCYHLFSIVSNHLWLPCHGVQMFHLMPTPQGSFFVLNDIFRLNYAWWASFWSQGGLELFRGFWYSVWLFDISFGGRICSKWKSEKNVL